MAFFRFNSSSHGHHHLVYGSSSCGATLQQCATTIGFGIRRPTTTTTTCALRFSARTKMDVGLGRRRRGIIFGAARSPTPGDLSRVQSQTLNEIAQEDEEKVSGKGLVSSHGWRVRDASRFDTEELRAVAHIQASSFHLQTAVFDQLFFKLFKAELLSALLYKARQSPPNRYACLLAEPVPEVDQEHLDTNRELKVVGAVNLTALVDSDVLRHLQGAHEYLYVSGMAVDADYRRQNVATLLLKACDLRASDWEFDWLVLHAYEDDVAARSLYSRAGYRVIAADPLWMTTWAGRKRRVLMAKGISGMEYPLTWEGMIVYVFAVLLSLPPLL
ncbi:hypothetical protein CY35_14G070400 [Sphagnum magellanicum]|nr:hypothetical protein CY35_14G070400 [Sphagnum magellanicum]